MVLQRQTDIPIWGTANPETEITVVLADSKEKTTSDKLGEWMVRLPRLEAGGPYKLEVFESGKSVPSMVFNDVLIGDVWLASGQSNMEWQVQQSEGAEKEIPNAFNSNIRLFNLPHNISLEPTTNLLKTSWRVCDSVSVKKASAVGYYFAKKIESTTGIPIGILQSTWGGTPVEAWTSREMLLSEPIAKGRVLQNDSITYDDLVKDSIDLKRFWDIVYNPKNGTDTIIPIPDFDDRNWREVAVPGVINEWEPEFYEGIIWLRKTVNLKGDFCDRDLTLNLGYPEMNYSLYFNGTEICKTIWNANLLHTYAIPDSLVKKGENTITLRMAALWGGGGLNPPGEDIYLSNGKNSISLTGTWKYKKDLEPAIPWIHYYHYFPTYLYNAMINPIIPYGLKGFIWYQGEANDTAAYNYRELFPLLITDWRIRWKQGYLPFLFVQLPNFMKTDPEPSDGRWAVMRESQFETIRLPNTGMACIIDLGEADNIHPRNKKDVGDRLADVARKMVYGEDLLASGPIFKSYDVEGNKIRIKFIAAGKELTTVNNQPVKGFAIAGADKKFYWASAKIEGNEVVVSSDRVQHPVAVRYAWADNPLCNLINSEGLPAVPFRTDTWKVITEN